MCPWTESAQTRVRHAKHVLLALTRVHIGSGGPAAAGRILSEVGVEEEDRVEYRALTQVLSVPAHDSAEGDGHSIGHTELARQEAGRELLDPWQRRRGEIELRLLHGELSRLGPQVFDVLAVNVGEFPSRPQLDRRILEGCLEQLRLLLRVLPIVNQSLHRVLSLYDREPMKLLCRAKLGERSLTLLAERVDLPLEQRVDAVLEQRVLGELRWRHAARVAFEVKGVSIVDGFGTGQRHASRAARRRNRRAGRRHRLVWKEAQARGSGGPVPRVHAPPPRTADPGAARIGAAARRPARRPHSRRAHRHTAGAAASRSEVPCPVQRTPGARRELLCHRHFLLRLPHIVR